MGVCVLFLNFVHFLKVFAVAGFVQKGPQALGFSFDSPSLDLAGRVREGGHGERPLGSP